MRSIRARIDTHLVLHIQDVPTDAYLELIDDSGPFVRSNPEFWKKKRMGFWTGKIPRKLYSWAREGMFLILPRGAIDKVKKFLLEHDCRLNPIKDKTVRSELQDFKLTGRSVLRPYQRKAVQALVQAGGGMIRGPCGSGKSTILIGTIAELNQSTIIVVHSKALARQWRGAINAWLGFQPGQIESGKKIIRPVTVAMQQSLWKLIEKGDTDWIDKFGVLIGDECFEPATPVLMANGTTKPISQIKQGESVAVGGKVIHSMSRFYSGRIWTLNGWKVTPDHPIATKKGWVKVSSLDNADLLLYGPDWKRRTHGKEKKSQVLYSLRKQTQETQPVFMVSKTWKRTIRPLDGQMQDLSLAHLKRASWKSYSDQMWDPAIFTLEQRKNQGNRSTNQSCFRKSQRSRMDRREAKEPQTCSQQRRIQAQKPKESIYCTTSPIREKRRTICQQRKSIEACRRRKDYSIWSWNIRKWASSNRIRKRNDIASLSCWLQERVHCENWCMSSTSNTLQDRSCPSWYKSCRGVRWLKSQRTSRDRRAKNIFPSIKRLDRAPLPGSFRFRYGRANVQEHCQGYYGKVCNLETEKGVYVAGGVLVHNCHRFASRTFQIVANAFPTAYRIGASADERRKDGLEFLIYETFGEVVSDISRKELVDGGKLLPSRMEIVPTDYEDEIYLQSIDSKEVPDWVGMTSRLVCDEERNNLIFSHLLRVLSDNFIKTQRIPVSEETPVGGFEGNSLLSSLPYREEKISSLLIKILRWREEEKYRVEKREEENYRVQRRSIVPIPSKPPTGVSSGWEETSEKNIESMLSRFPRILLLSSRVETCRRWIQRLRSFGIPAGLMVGGQKNRQELNDTISGLIQGRVLVGVATTVADEGLDIPPLTHVFITYPCHKHPKRMQQMIGRAARLSEGKEEAVCVYFWDRHMFPFQRQDKDGLIYRKKLRSFHKGLERLVDQVEILDSM